MIECLKAKGAVPDAGGQTDERPVAKGGISLRLRLLGKRKTDQQERDEKCRSGEPREFLLGVKRCDCFLGYFFHRR